jgi:hypothetical protein
MELSELTNKELKNILRQNQVKNYSKLNKKNLLKKVNELIKSQNGGNSKKKYRLRGGSRSPKKSADTGHPPGATTPGAPSGPPPGPHPGYTAPPPYNPSAPPPGAPPFYSPPTGASAPPLDPPPGAHPLDPPPSYLSPNEKKKLDGNQFMMLKNKIGQEPPQRLAFNAIRENYGEELTDHISSENDKSKKKNECEPCAIL